MCSLDKEISNLTQVGYMSLISLALGLLTRLIPMITFLVQTQRSLTRSTQTQSHPCRQPISNDAAF